MSLQHANHVVPIRQEECPKHCRQQRTNPHPCLVRHDWPELLEQAFEVLVVLPFIFRVCACEVTNRSLHFFITWQLIQRARNKRLTDAHEEQLHELAERLWLALDQAIQLTQERGVDIKRLDARLCVDAVDQAFGPLRMLALVTVDA